MTRDEFADLRHVVIDQSSGHSQVDHLLESMSAERRVALRLHHFSVLPQIVARNDYAVIAPLCVAELFTTQQPVTYRECPFNLPAFDVSLYWNGAAPISAAHTWFRETIANALK